MVVRENTECLVGRRITRLARQVPLIIFPHLQYVKQEQLIPTENGKEARATRLITERASRRIGKMAFEIALGRPRKACFGAPSHYANTYA